jgi:hypothetical protein
MISLEEESESPTVALSGVDVNPDPTQKQDDLSKGNGSAKKTSVYRNTNTSRVNINEAEHALAHVLCLIGRLSVDRVKDRRNVVLKRSQEIPNCHKYIANIKFRLQLKTEGWESGLIRRS